MTCFRGISLLYGKRSLFTVHCSLFTVRLIIVTPAIIGPMGIWSDEGISTNIDQLNGRLQPSSLLPLISVIEQLALSQNFFTISRCGKKPSDNSH